MTHSIMRFLVVCFVLLMSVPDFALAQEETRKGAGPNVEIWLPPDFREHDGPWPLVIYSHGLGGCAKQSSFLTAHIAEHGYIVAAPDHADGKPCLKEEVKVRRLNGDIARPEKPLRFPDQWTDETEADRREDILFTLQSLTDDPQFKGLIDLEHVGLIGYSLGGYTVMGLAGAWPSWKDPRFKAIVALSPYAAPYALNGDIQGISVPVMYQGGTKDPSFTPLVENVIYPRTPASKYFVMLEGAGHSAWAQTRWEEPINRSVLAFFDRYLKGNTAPVLPDKPGKGVKAYYSDEGKGP